MGAVALVTAVLNLDTSVVFMTPVALQAARAEGADETAFLFGTIFMSNSASLLLPGSNLTNLLVWSHRHASGVQFARHMAWPWIISISITVLVVGAWRWRPLGKSVRPTATDRSFEFGPGLVAGLFAVVAMLALTAPALWVCAAGVIAEIVAWGRRRVALSGAIMAINPVTLGALFVIAVVIGPGYHVERAPLASHDSVGHGGGGGGGVPCHQQSPGGFALCGSGRLSPLRALAGTRPGSEYFRDRRALVAVVASHRTSEWLSSVDPHVHGGGLGDSAGFSGVRRRAHLTGCQFTELG
jgi:hypothetical protein